MTWGFFEIFLGREFSKCQTLKTIQNECYNRQMNLSADSETKNCFLKKLIFQDFRFDFHKFFKKKSTYVSSLVGTPTHTESTTGTYLLTGQQGYRDPFLLAYYHTLLKHTGSSLSLSRVVFKNFFGKIFFQKMSKMPKIMSWGFF